MSERKWEVIQRIRGGWWVVFSGLPRDVAAALAASRQGAFAQPEESDDRCLPVVEWS